jgi:hypothetical protein
MASHNPIDEAAPDLAAWAGRQLRLSEGAAPAQAHGLVLRGLAHHEFVPTPEWQEAFDVIYRSGRAKGPCGRAWCDEETRLRAEVESFATEFFKLSPQERRSRWQALALQCRPFPRLVARLEGLEPGLDVEAVAISPKERQLLWLAEQATTLFVLRPPERAARRQALLANVATQGANLEKAASRFQKRHSALAALEPDLIGKLAAWTKSENALSKVLNAQPKKRPTSGQSIGAGSAAGIGWLLIMLVGALSRGLNSHSSTTNSPTYSPPPIQWKTQQFNVPQPVTVDPWNGRRPWNPAAPQSAHGVIPLGNGLEPAPVQRPGEPSYVFAQRLVEWRRRQAVPVAPNTIPGFGGRPGVEIPGMPRIPGWNAPIDVPGMPYTPQPPRSGLPSSGYPATAPKLPGRP